MQTRGVITVLILVISIAFFTQFSSFSSSPREYFQSIPRSSFPHSEESDTPHSLVDMKVISDVDVQ